jgi:hypothetical protein
MRRREFLALLAGASVLPPVSAGAQQSTKVYRIAMLHPSHPVAQLTETSSLPYYRAFFDELRRLGYVEGQNLVIERDSGEGHAENYLALARSVVSRNPELVFTVQPMGTSLKMATSTRAQHERNFLSIYRRSRGHPRGLTTPRRDGGKIWTVAPTGALPLAVGLGERDRVGCLRVRATD